MKLIDRYIFKSMLLPVLFGVGIFTMLLLVNVFIEIIEVVFANDFPIVTIADYFSYLIPGILSQTIPMGTFLGVMLTYGALSENNEIIAIEGNGISLTRIIKPALILGILLTLLGLFLEVYVNPEALRKLNLQNKSLIYSKPSSLTEEKTFFTNDEKGFSFYIDEVNNESGIAERFLLFQKREKAKYPEFYLSKEAKFDVGKLSLIDVEGYRFDENGELEVKASFVEQVIPYSTLFTANTEDGKTKSRNEMSLRELKEYEKTQINSGAPRDSYIKYSVEFFERIIGPFATVFLCILGVLLSVRHNRTGRGISFGISLLVIFAYISLVSYAKVLIYKNNFPVALTMWIPNIILMLVCLRMFLLKMRSE